MESRQVPLLPQSGITLHAKAQQWTKLSNLDDFIRSVYVYYCHCGFWPYVAAQVFDVLALTLVVVILVTLAAFVDFGRLMTAAELTDALGYTSDVHWAAWLLLLVAAAGLIGRCVSAAYTIAIMRHTASFYQHVLELPDDLLALTPWSLVLARLSPLWAELQGHDHATHPEGIMTRLMRYDNYMIALTRGHKFHSSCSSWHCMLSHTFYWGIYFTLVPAIQRFQPDHLREQAAWLRRRMLWVGLAGLALSPALLVVVTVYYLFRYGEYVRSEPLFLSSRHWSLEAQWQVRQYFEPMHELRNRLAGAAGLAKDYAASRTSDVSIAVAQFVSFCASAACVLILALALVDDDVLVRQTLFGRALVWWLGIAGVCLAGARSYIPSQNQGTANEPPLQQPEMLQRLTAELGMRQEDVRARFNQLYEYRALGFVWELASVILAPLLFLTVMRARCDELLNFLNTNSHMHFGIGYVYKVRE